MPPAKKGLSNQDKRHSLEMGLFKRKSYGALNDDEKKQVKTYFDVVSDKTTKSNYLMDDRTIASNRQSISESIKHYDRKIPTINPASFQFLDKPQREHLKQELYLAFYIYSAQFQLDCTEDRSHTLKKLGDQIKHCAKLMAILRYVEAKDKGNLSAELDRSIEDSDKHLKYLGTTMISPILVDMVLGISVGDTISLMSNINSYRLYWVWARSFIDSILALFTTTGAARDALDSPSPVTGYMSWVLYYLRGSFQLALLLKHTISGPWMSKREKNIPWHERFNTQWEHRKFRLLNDFIWATANLACFFWLVGTGVLGFWGNALTAILLLMDISITIWQFEAARTQHEKEMQQYTEDLKDLFLLQSKLAVNDQDLVKKQIKWITDERKQCEKEWRFQLRGLHYDLAYAVSLLIAFSMLCCFFFPPLGLVPLATVILGVGGAALCFALTVLYSTLNKSLKISQTHRLSQTARDEYNDGLVTFERLKNELAVCPEGEKLKKEHVMKQLYLELLQLDAKSDYQRALIPYQRIELIHSTIMNLLIPPIILTALMFLPLGLGLGVLALGFVLAFVTNKYFENYTRFAPEIAKWQCELNTCKTPPEDKDMQDHCFYIYQDKENHIHCCGKNMTGDLDRFIINDNDLGKHALQIRESITQGKSLNDPEKDQIYHVLSKKGFDFKLPSFDQKKYDEFFKHPPHPQLNFTP